MHRQFDSSILMPGYIPIALWHNPIAHGPQDQASGVLKRSPSWYIGINFEKLTES